MNFFLDTNPSKLNIWSFDDDIEIIIVDNVYEFYKSSGKKLTTPETLRPATQQDIDDFIEREKEKNKPSLKSLAKIARLKTDDIVLKCIENDIKLPADWKKYRKDLRDIESGKSVATELPIEPTDPIPS